MQHADIYKMYVNVKFSRAMDVDLTPTLLSVAYLSYSYIYLCRLSVDYLREVILWCITKESWDVTDNINLCFLGLSLFSSPFSCVSLLIYFETLVFWSGLECLKGLLDINMCQFYFGVRGGLLRWGKMKEGFSFKTCSWCTCLSFNENKIPQLL